MSKSAVHVMRLPDGQLRYFYNASPDISCEFSLLSEVGQGWQADARASLARLETKGYTIRYGVELAAKPWVSDFAIK